MAKYKKRNNSNGQPLNKIPFGKNFFIDQKEGETNVFISKKGIINYLKKLKEYKKKLKARKMKDLFNNSKIENTLGTLNSLYNDYKINRTETLNLINSKIKSINKLLKTDVKYLVKTGDPTTDLTSAETLENIRNNVINIDKYLKTKGLVLTREQIEQLMIQFKRKKTNYYNFLMENKDTIHLLNPTEKNLINKWCDGEYGTIDNLIYTLKFKLRNNDSDEIPILKTDIIRINTIIDSYEINKINNELQRYLAQTKQDKTYTEKLNLKSELGVKVAGLVGSGVLINYLQNWNMPTDTIPNLQLVLKTIPIATIGVIIINLMTPIINMMNINLKFGPNNKNKWEN